ncbi:MAG: LPS-assembly protein LptD [Acidobacteriota bacterium]
MRLMLCIPVLSSLLITSSAFSQDRARAELPYEGGTVVIEADRLLRESEERWVAEGSVIVTYGDALLKAPQLIYNPVSGLVQVEGGFELTRGLQWLQGSRAEINLKTNTGTLYDASGFTEQELFIKADKLIKTGPATYEVQDGFLTACEEALPLWSFKTGEADIELDGTARLKHTLFRIKQVPLFYFPYLIIPTAEKERSSGLMLPTTGNSSDKGRRISESFYLVLGRSADAMIRGDYFSKRGFGYGLTLRARPNQVSYLQFDGYLVNDRKGQGGASIDGIGQTRFGEGFRAVADFNLVTNFIFRQVFSDNFFAATRPTENSRVFLTNNSGAKSFNLFFSSDQTLFPVRDVEGAAAPVFDNVVIQSKPTFNFKLLGQQVFDWPAYLDLDTSAGALSRSDHFAETPGVTQRFDFFPQLYFSVPLFQGLRLTPRLGFRDTFYSDSLSGDSAEGEPLSVLGEDLNREYLQVSVDLKGWGLSKIYTGGDGIAAWKHLIEPTLKYRYISRIDEFDRVIRFDERDAIASTNSVEYALFNRFFIKRTVDGAGVNHELLSIKVAQHHFFDPDFGGALKQGAINQFFPINTLTGFPYGATARDYSPLVTAVRINPTPSYSFDIRGDFDPRFDRMRNFSVTGFLNRQGFNLGTTYFVTEELEPGTFNSEQIQGHVAFGNFDRGFSVSSLFSYDAEISRFLTFRSRVNYFWDCFGLSLEYQGFNLGIGGDSEFIRQERQFRFSFFLKGIGAFGTIKRPDISIF